ncbi:ABC transporter permease subunit [Thalassobacillus sp. CUG 92003]|uniref:ABC transporter permease subunit n=1 Tax=Thalassobacillus sp. CUG 92003 TaxID=2736641 RepID=UPI0015E62CEB|nr:ABC transporter permease subunit [Thalassobacillus sp. CUG 92003]
MKSLKTKPYLILLAPGLLFLVLPFYAWVAGVGESFGFEDSPTLAYYSDLFHSERFLASLGFSLRTSLVATILADTIGFLITRWCYASLTTYAHRLTVWLPMLFPHFVWGYVVILIVSETGVAAQLLEQWGWISSEAFPVLTRDQHGIGIILTYVWKEVPFVILMLYPVYATMSNELKDVVATVGGGRFQQFKTVEWPNILPTLFETSLIIFSFTLTAYEVPALLGTTFPEMVSVLSYQWFYSSDWDERHLAFAAMALFSMIILFVTLIGYLFLNKRRWLMTKGQS